MNVCPGNNLIITKNSYYIKLLYYLNIMHITKLELINFPNNNENNNLEIINMQCSY